MKASDGPLESRSQSLTHSNEDKSTDQAPNPYATTIVDSSEIPPANSFQLSLHKEGFGWLNCRWKDNAFQMGAVGCGTLVGGFLGFLISPIHLVGEGYLRSYVLVGSVLGFIAGVVISGTVLMFRDWK